MQQFKCFKILIASKNGGGPEAPDDLVALGCQAFKRFGFELQLCSHLWETGTHLLTFSQAVKLAIKQE